MKFIELLIVFCITATSTRVLLASPDTTTPATNGIEDLLRLLKKLLKLLLELLKLLKKLLEDLKKILKALSERGKNLKKIGTVMIETTHRSGPLAFGLIGQIIHGAGMELCEIDTTAKYVTPASKLRMVQTGVLLIAATNHSTMLYDELVWMGVRKKNTAEVLTTFHTLATVATGIKHEAMGLPTAGPKVTLIKAADHSPGGSWPCMYDMWITFEDSNPSKWDYTDTGHWVEDGGVERVTNSMGFNNKLGVFNGTTYLAMPLFKNKWFRKVIVLYVRFKVSSRNHNHGLDSIINVNGCEGDKTSLFLGYDRNGQKVVARGTMKDATNQDTTVELSFNAKIGTWIEAKATFDGHKEFAVLQGTVNGVGVAEDRRNGVKRRIKTSPTQLYVGSGKDTAADCDCCRNFVGEMDLVTVRECAYLKKKKVPTATLR